MKVSFKRPGPQLMADIEAWCEEHGYSFALAFALADFAKASTELPFSCAIESQSLQETLDHLGQQRRALRMQMEMDDLDATAFVLTFGEAL